ncbi:MAG: histidine phosphatase family protein [Pseudomonadota bacterium]
MKTLILMRHTKAAAPIPDQPDFDRSLAPRGEENARALGAWLREHNHIPDLALVSSAQRTRETWEGLAMEDQVPVKLVDDLYDAVPSGYFSLLGKLESDSALIIGHNPTVASVAEHTLRETEVPAALSSYPTGATAVIRFDVDDWDAITKAPGTLANWIVPRQLTASA